MNATEKLASCLWPEMTLGIATEILKRTLEEEGLRLVEAEALPKMAPARGPITSHLAAAAVNDLPDRHYAVYFALSVLGTATDQELADAFDGIRRDYRLVSVGPQTTESLRTRRDELAKAGKVQFTGEYRPTRSGRKAMVWETA